MNSEPSKSESMLPKREQEILDTALRESDQLLARTLHDDERRRRKRRWILWSALVIGGVVMTKLMLGLMSGWLVASAPVVAEPKPTKAETEEVQGPSDQEWRERLLAVQEDDSWSVGAKIGMELVQIPGDRPYKILAASWRKIATSGRKQILKGFTPGMMGNKKVHPRFFDVMHLGMTDRDADVRSYAATYIEMQGLPNFKDDAKGYERWRKQNKDRTAKEIIENKEVEVSERAPTPEQIAQAEKSATAGWQLWQQQKYTDAVGKFTMALQLNPKAVHAWNGLGWSHFHVGGNKKGEEAFRKCIALEPDHGGALNGLGFCLLNQGDAKQAKPLFEKCLKMQKDAAGPMNGLARCLKAEGKVDQAIEVWEQVAKKHPGPTAATAGLAQTYLEKKQYAKAVKYYKILVKSAPKNEFFQQGLEQAQTGMSTGD
jgi:Tfp pilus assembly protein PilF